MIRPPAIFSGHNVLMDIKKRNPKMNNVYCELGSFFNTLSVIDPVMAAHGLGKNIKYYGVDRVVWGTIALWWGSPQWSIDAFKRFQMPDEMCEKFGYKKLTNRTRQRSSAECGETLQRRCESKTDRPYRPMCSQNQDCISGRWRPTQQCMFYG
jgi:hypothetical protein